MTLENSIRNEYFEWLYNYVCKGRVHNGVSYNKLFKLLHSIEFTFTIPNDINRARDGVDLRYRFSLYKDNELIMKVLDNGPCSVLEMIIALAIRCEETIMDDPRYGNRTSQWFWNMLRNLDISDMSDDIFDEKYVLDKIDDFLFRRYEPNGKGGLFYIRNCAYDLRDEDIWTQLCWYLDKIT